MAMSFRLFGQTITVSSPLRDDEEKAASSIQQKEISFTFIGEPIKVSSPVRDHLENHATPLFLDDHDLEKTLSVSREKDQEEKELDDPYNNNPNPNPEPKSPVSDEPQKKRQKIRREASQPQPQPQEHRDLSTEFLRIIEPALPVFLYRKRLTETDVNRGQNRLLVTEKEKEKLMQFLTPDEKLEISKEENSSIEVQAVDCTGTKFNLRLSTWKGSSGDQGEASSSSNTKPKKKKKTVVFNQQWCAMLEANGVEPYDIAELWGFRRDGKFWLAANFFHP